MPMIFAPYFERLTACCGSYLFCGIMYFVFSHFHINIFWYNNISYNALLSPKITNSNSFEIRHPFRGSDGRSCDCFWRSITLPFFPTWYYLFSVSVSSTSFQSSLTECSILFSNWISSFVFTWFLATSSSTVLILFETNDLSSRWVLTDSFRFFCISVIVFSAFLISLLSRSIFGEFACSVILNVLPSSFWSCNFKLLFSDSNNSICTCNAFCSFFKNHFGIFFQLLGMSLSPLSISLLIKITWVSISLDLIVDLIWFNSSVILICSAAISLYDLLNKNLNFCPIAGHYNKSISKTCSESFNREIEFKAFFHNKNAQKQETELANKEPNIKSKTNWKLKRKHHTVETLMEAVNKDIAERFQIKINYLKK